MKRLLDADLNYIPEEPMFVNLGASYIQEIDDHAKIYDPALLEFGNAIGAEPDDGSAMDASLAQMAFTQGKFQSESYDPINTEIASFYPGFESALSQNETDLKDNPTPGGGTNPDPPPTPPGTGGGPGGGPPVAQACTAADFPGVTCKSMKVLNPGMKGDAPRTAIYVSSDQRATTYKLVSGDTSLWSLREENQAVGSGPYGSGPLHNVILTCNMSEAGHFGAAVSIQLAGDAGPSVYCYCIDIGGGSTSTKGSGGSPPTPPANPVHPVQL